MPIQEYTLAAFGTLKAPCPSTWFFSLLLCNIFSLCKKHTYIFSLGLKWVDKIKAVSIEFPIIPAKPPKIIWKEKLPIQKKKKNKKPQNKTKQLCIIQYIASGSTPNLLGKRSFSPNVSQNLLTVKVWRTTGCLFFCQYISTVCACLNATSFTKYHFNISNSVFLHPGFYGVC